MKTLKIIFLFFFSVNTILCDMLYAQPTILRESMPRDLPPQLKQQIERLYSQDPVNRGDAAMRLGQMGSRAARAIPFLIGILGDTQLILIRNETTIEGSTSPAQQAVIALSMIGEPAVNPLISALKDKDSYVREYAAEALGLIKNPRAIEPLISALKDKRSKVQKKSLDALTAILEEIKNRHEVNYLIAIFNNKDYDYSVRRLIVDTMKNCKDDRLIVLLITALHDNDSYIRESAVEALKNFGTSAVKPLIAALKDEDMLVQSTAINLLGEIRDDRAVEPVSLFLKNKEQLIRAEAARALGKIKDQRSVIPLVTALKDKDIHVHDAAVEALKGIGPPAVEPLIAALKDEDMRVQSAAIRLLGEIRDDRAVELVSLFLKNTAWYMRVEAARALGKIKDPRALEPLRNALNDKNHDVQDMVEWALDEIEKR
jgi:HEAT repeat protein